MSDHKEVRAEVYEILAEGLKEPNEEFWSAVTTKELQTHLVEMLERLGYELSLSFADNYSNMSLKDFQEEFKKSFLKPNERIIPVESIFKQWTNDSSAEVSIAREKGYLRGDSALHMEALLEKLGISIPEEMQATPDHLIILLEVMAVLCRHDKLNYQQSFVKEHFDWLADLKEAAEKLESDFYRGWIQLIYDFVTEDAEAIN